MRTLLALLLLLVSFPALALRAPGGATPDAYVRAEMAVRHIPGLALAVAR